MVCAAEKWDEPPVLSDIFEGVAVAAPSFYKKETVF